MRDCSAAVLDGVWPYELMTPRPETEVIARYLRDDLDKIVSRTNERLAEMDSWRAMPPEQRMAEETRVINVARALAVLRVESTVRSLGGRAITVSPHVVEVTRAIEADLMSRPAQAERPDSSAGRRSGPGAPRGGARRPAPGPPPPRGAAPRPEPRPQPGGGWPTPPPPSRPQAQPSQPAEFAPRPAARHFAAEDDDYSMARNSEPVSGPVVIVDAEDVTTEVPRDAVGEGASVEQPSAASPPDSERRSERDVEETTSAVARDDVASAPRSDGRSEPTPEETTMVVAPGDFAPPTPPPAAAPRDFAPPAPSRPAPAPRSPRPAAAPRGHVEGRPVMGGPDQLQEWLEQVVGILARQQPALKWVVGERGDGSIVVATDVASGWIPPGVVLPAGVVALEPERRSGRLEDWVGQVERGARYEPGDRIPPSTVPAGMVEKPFAVVEVPEDLGWQLGEATRLHEGLPRIAHTLAKAGAARTGVPEAEMDVLAVQVETMVQSMLAGYPGVSEAGVVTCMLIGAAEAMAAGHTVLAAYHYAWYETFAGRRWE